MNTNTAITTTRINGFRAALQAGIDGIVKAAGIYVEAIDEDPKASDAFRDEMGDMVPHSAWAQFEAVGRKWMHPKLLMGGVGASTKRTNAIKRLPYSQQERVFNHDRFPLLTSTGDTLSADILEVTDDQLAQLCDGSHIRTLSEQRAWIEARAAAAATAPFDIPEVMPYTIESGRLTIRRGATFTKAEVRRILMEM